MAEEKGAIEAAEPPDVEKTICPTESFIVDWDENDPDNPLNWPSKRKAVNIALLSCLTFVT
jgi:hypothetical protein